MLSLLLILSGLGRLTSEGHHLETSLLQITVPRKIETNTSDGEVPETQVTYVIQIDRKTYTFHLKKQSFLDPHFLVFAYNKSGTLYPDSSFIKGHCFYQGYATEVPKSAVTLSICSGLRGSLQLENVSYGIEPLESTTVYEHMLYQINNDKNDFSPSKENFLMPHLVQKSYKILVKSKVIIFNSEMKFIFQFDYMGSEVAVAAEKVVHIFGLINIVMSNINRTEMLYSSFKKHLSLLRDPILKRKILLFSYRDHPNYVGATYHGMACNPKFAAGIALYPQTITLEAFSVVMTQLLGVSLGLTYNNDIFTCYCPGTTCIMNSKAIRSHGVKFFSSCSMDEFKRMISQPEFECLQNQIASEVVYQKRHSLCGNGILEPPEQCDCGEFQKCCNPADCTLTEFADCGTGPCCDRETCLISIRGTLCRESKDPCDFPEFCNGKNEYCVPDAKSADLEPCNNKTAYCYNGVCQDTDKQCADLFGKFAKGSTLLCTQEVNMQDDDFGNCKRTFCNFRDILCGKIVCHWTRLEIIPFKKFDVQYTYMEGHLCVSAYLRVPTKYVKEDFTYASDGTMCGPNKVNKNLTWLSMWCSPNCGKNQDVCNNFFHCHCDVGYSPPLCIPSRTSKGGSIDDGFWSKYLPIKRHPPSQKNNFLFGFYIFLPLLVLTAIIAFKFNKIRFGDREGTATEGFITEDSDSNSTMSES
uniref:A disintegrin and metallopeptidase domain 3-like n=1 Tax=Neovison vison TaxID=452646 RepID=A0A8C7AQV7_NEOVI